MAEENLYKWTDNPTVSGVAKCDTDVLNECLMHLKYESENPNILKTNQITNCLLEVPQNIKLELNNGTLTLKAGSKVIVPNGVGVFDEVEIQNDISVTPTHSNTEPAFLFVINGSSLTFEQVDQSFSGSSAPSGFTYIKWYDTANNLVKRTGNGGATWTSGLSLPIAIYHNKNNVTESIDQVFNGIGYIGSTIFMVKGTKVLIPNGRNADGTLKNIEYTTDTVAISDRSVLDGENRAFLFNYTRNTLEDKAYSEDNKIIAGSGQYVYNPITNNIYNSGGQNSRWVLCGLYTSVNGQITNFQPKQPFRAVDYNDFKNLNDDFANTPHITQTYINGTSGYIVYSNGLCEQWGATTNSGTSSATVTLIKPYKDTNYNVLATKNNINGGNPNNAASWNINTKTVSSFMYSQGDSNGKGCNWRTIGYIA